MSDENQAGMILAGFINDEPVPVGMADVLDDWTPGAIHPITLSPLPGQSPGAFRQTMLSISQGTGGWSMKWRLSCGDDHLDFGGFFSHVKPNVRDAVHHCEMTINAIR